MLSNVQKNIIVRAVKIRMEKGEELTDILDSYPKLSEEDREEVSGMVTGHENCDHE